MIQGQWNPVLNIPEGKSGKYSIRHFKTQGNVDAFNLRTLFHGQKRRTIPFDGERTWHSLREGDGVWMTDLPIEQVQHDDQMESLKGAERVLVGGLGLGYAITKLVLDYDVQEIDVVEISPHVRDLVWPHIDERVRNRCRRWDMDIFDFIKQKAIPGDYDGAFYDIWASDGEHTFHTIVMKLRRMSYDLTDNVVCWNEDVMRMQLLTQLVSAYTMAMHGLQNQDKPGFTDADKELRLKANDIYHKWACPFWKAYFDNKIEVSRFMEQATFYVRLYGSVENWLEVWRKHVSSK